MIVRINVVLNRTVVVDSDLRFDNLCGSNLQSQRVTLTLKMTTAQAVETSVTVNKTVLFRTTFTRTIILNLLMKWLLGLNLSQQNVAR